MYFELIYWFMDLIEKVRIIRGIRSYLNYSMILQNIFKLSIKLNEKGKYANSLIDLSIFLHFESAVSAFFTTNNTRCQSYVINKKKTREMFAHLDNTGK